MKNTALLKAVVENAINGILTLDESGFIESMNPSACELFQYDESQAIGKNVIALMLSDGSVYHDKYLSDYASKGIPAIVGMGQLLGLRKDGSTFPMHLEISEVKYSGRILYAGFVHDITLQKESEARLVQYTAHLEELVEERTLSLNMTIADLHLEKEKVSQSLVKQKELNILKNNFLSMASHEFRTPLSTIQLSISLINRRVEAYTDINISKNVSKIKSAVTSITAILNDFLYVEVLDAVKVKPVYTHFDLVSLSTEITEELQEFSGEGQHIIYRHTGTLRVINLNQHYLKNCITNLIVNAIKYSGQNTTIEFSTEVVKTECIITVKDNGVGIPEEDHKYLFEAFFRAHNSGSVPGTGLGLYIVNRYVHLMKGEIFFTSIPDQGVVFTIVIPI